MASTLASAFTLTSTVVQAPQYIDFAAMSGFTREMVFAEIFKVLRIAGRYDGQVFGGFVRNVIVPREADPNCKVSFFNVGYNDVDLWFKNADTADAFVVAMGDAFRLYENCTITPENAIYPFARKQYHYYVHGTCVAWFDVIISEEYPVNDFDVNCLAYLYENNGISITSYLGFAIVDLERAILAKEATMLPPYVEFFSSKDDALRLRQSIHFGRVDLKYRGRGWKIFVGTTECHKPQYMLCLYNFRRWVRRSTPTPTPTAGSIGVDAGSIGVDAGSIGVDAGSIELTPTFKSEPILTVSTSTALEPPSPITPTTTEDETSPSTSAPPDEELAALTLQLFETRVSELRKDLVSALRIYNVNGMVIRMSLQYTPKL